ncbi:MAG: hypothetical protein ACREQF_07435 [Candidatus Binataceae bacterium]
MQQAHASDVQWERISGHRSGEIDFKRLLQGAAGAPDNYELSVVRTGGDYFTPRHRHNFDQVRFCLSGVMNFAPGKDLKADAVGYFPEGTFYGPQAMTQPSEVLLLQHGGAAGYGFMSYQQLTAGYEALRAKGEFEKGAFSYRDAEGRTHRKDGYEAVWEHVNGRAVEYPPPRYDEPVTMNPANFKWVAVPGVEGFEVKHLGTFGERDLRVGFVRASRGAKYVSRDLTSPELIYVIDGTLKLSGKALGAQSAARLDASDNGGTIEAVEASEVFFVRLPAFAAPPRAN